MTNSSEPSDLWFPRYPEPKDEIVRMRSSCDAFSVLRTSRGMEIVVPDAPLENPACFWIDKDHVYLRTSWSTWGPVEFPDPELAAILCKSSYFRINQTENGFSESCCIVPVYHVASLPEKLFCGDDVFVSSHSGKSGTDKNDIRQSIDKIKKIVDGIPTSMEALSSVQLGVDIASVVIADDDHAVIMEVLPENMDFVFSSASDAADDEQNGTNDWPAGNNISMRFIEKLRRMQKYLKEIHPESVINIGFLANADTIDLLELYLSLDGITDLKLFTYENLEKDISDVFFPKNDTKDETIADRVRNMIAEQLGISASDVHDDTRLGDDLGADELDMVELIMALEEEFDCVFPDDLERFCSVKDLVVFIENYKA